MKRPLLIACAIALAALSIALAAYALIESLTGRQALATVRQKMEADRSLLPISEIGQNPSPEALSNGARLLAVVGPLEQMIRNSPDVPDLLLRQDASPGFARPMISLPAPSFDPSAKTPPITWPDLADQLEPASSILTESRDLLQQPVAFPHEYGNMKSVLPAGECNHLAAYLRTSAACKIQAGDMSGALDDLTALQSTVRLIGSTHTIIGNVLQIGLWQFAFAPVVWEILQTRTLSDADLSRLAALTAQPLFIEDTLRSLKVEAASLPLLYRDIRDSRTSFTTEPFYEAPKAPLDDPLLLKLRDLAWPFIWSDGDQAAALSISAKALPIAETILVDRNWHRVGPLLKQEPPALSNYDLWRFPLSSVSVAMALPHTVLRVAIRTEISRQLILAAIALERYRLKHQSYPDSLAELVPAYLPAIPHDWFDGQPLTYRRLSPDTFLLYSVGEDGEDNNGDFTTSKSNSRDLPWPQPAPLP